MGSAPWDCFTEYQPDLSNALQHAREKALETKSYSCSCEDGDHASFEDAMECADADGTCSIIDIEDVSSHFLKGGRSDEPGVAYALSPDHLTNFFGTDKPTKEAITGAPNLSLSKMFGMIGRGCAVHVTVFRDGQPSEIYFAGMSYD